MSTAAALPFTAAQGRLLDRHRSGLARLARVLAEKTGGATTDIMFLLAHATSNVGVVARQQLGGHAVQGKGAVILPGMANELPLWLARLALAGPIVHCTHIRAGLPVIVIDKHNAMALCRVTCLTPAAGDDAQSCGIMSVD